MPLNAGLACQPPGQIIKLILRDHFLLSAQTIKSIRADIKKYPRYADNKKWGAVKWHIQLSLNPESGCRPPGWIIKLIPGDHLLLSAQTKKGPGQTMAHGAWAMGTPGAGRPLRGQNTILQCFIRVPTHFRWSDLPDPTRSASGRYFLL